MVRQQTRYDRCNVGHHATFAKMEVTPEWVRNDPDLAAPWALDRFVTTAETAARRRRRLDGELTKISEEWPLCSANVGRGKTATRALNATLVVASAALRTAQQQWVLREQQTTARKGCRDTSVSFRHWRDDDDDDIDRDDGVGEQGDHVYEVVVRSPRLVSIVPF
ncbi:Importin subunit beta-1 [Hordeum vulgare]|nr:Importin subunit beta-1 [Hordeum vulgare]